MTTEAVKVARLQAKASDKAAMIDLAKSVLTNPLGLGVVALAANYAAFRAGAYRGVPARSVLGGPVWFQIGKGLTPEQDQYARYEGFIMTATTAFALSGALKGGTVLGELVGALK